MKSLIVEDEFTSRRLLQIILSPYGECDVAVNGKEAVNAFGSAREDDAPYDLVCLDLMMPEMDGQATLEAIRKIEKDHEPSGNPAVKVIITTVLDDAHNVARAFSNGCEAYVIKPIAKYDLLKQIRELGLMEGEPVCES